MSANVLSHAESARLAVGKDHREKEKYGQYLTSAPLARMMASFMTYGEGEIRLLDPGAGAGSLSAACVEAACNQDHPPRDINLTAYEIDPFMVGYMRDTLRELDALCRDKGIGFSSTLVEGDFIRHYVEGKIPEGYTHCIINPPYGKINVSSETYKMMSSANMQSTNTYSAFIDISKNLLWDGGQLAFITPRSFCNGRYFLSFRRRFLDTMSIQRIHVFDSRASSFSDDGVLQENVIMGAIKGLDHVYYVSVSASHGPEGCPIQRCAESDEIVRHGDPHMFIHIEPDEYANELSRAVRNLDNTLDDLDLGISTGRVVDFRVPDSLRFEDAEYTVPLVRPSNISGGVVRFPLQSKKHHGFVLVDDMTRPLMVMNGTYVLVKRFTAKEERKRVVVAVWNEDGGTSLVGFENRINYMHRNGMGMPTELADGLWTFLNSTMVDMYVRQFAGSTQVNASDMRYLRYPSEEQIVRLGHMAGPGSNQAKIDEAMCMMFP